jgi:hypothetical protein
MGGKCAAFNAKAWCYGVAAIHLAPGFPRLRANGLLAGSAAGGRTHGWREIRVWARRFLHRRGEAVATDWPLSMVGLLGSSRLALISAVGSAALRRIRAARRCYCSQEY